MSANLKEKGGYLTKQGKTVKNWRKRWILLKNNSLYYFKSKDDASPLDSIPLSDCSCSFASYCETKKRSCLKINTPRRTWYFAADTDEEIGQWLEALFAWGVPESHEEDETISAIVETTNSLQAIASSVVQYSSTGSIETFRDTCRTATQRGDAFTASIQAITKYNATVKYSPTPNFNDFLKEVTVASGSIRDTFMALVTLATDARDSPSDNELKRKLTISSGGITEKIFAFKKVMHDDGKGIRPQLRAILYGKDRTYTQPSTPAPVSTIPLRSSGGLSPTTLSPAPSPTLSSTPPTSTHAIHAPIHIPTANLAASGNSGPPSPTAASSFMVNSPQTQTKSPRPLSQSLTVSGTVGGTSQSLIDEQKTQFEDLITMSKDLAQIMKNLRTNENETVTALPKSGYVTATMLVKAARDYANLHQHPTTRQEILAAAGRVFVATNQLYNPMNNDEEYSTDELLKSLSQSVLALVKNVLQHHNNTPTTPTPTLPTSSSAPANVLTHNNGHASPPTHTSAPTSPTALHQFKEENGIPANLYRSSSNGRLEHNGKKGAPLRYGSGNLNGKISYENNDVPTLITSTEGDVNIWDEVALVGTNVVFIDDEGLSADGELPIRGGTLNQIIKRLTNENKPELRFVKAFIITYPSFTTPEVFLNKLIQRYQVPVSVIEEGTLQLSDWRQQKLLPIQLRVYNVLKLWLEHRFHDFDETLIAKLKVFMEEYMRRDGHAKLADQLGYIITRKTTPENKKTLNIPNAPSMTKEAFWKKYPGEYMMNLDEEDVAKQLTLIEFTTYKAIEPLELLNQAWNKQSLRKRAPNVMRMISRFNSISFWVARMIINEEKLRARVKMMTKIIRLAQALYKENNLNSLLAIVAGMNNSAIHRLKFTHEELSNKDAEALAKFGSLLSSDLGYKNYRARVHTINPPLIPYLGIYLTDLTFIEEGNPDFLEGGLINFKKREMIFNVISEIQQYQQEPYKYEGIEQLISYLADLPIVEDQKGMDKELYDLSLQREPRGAQKSEIV